MTFLETNIDELVSANHPYRKILEIIDFKDRWLTQVRMPYEGTFSRMRKRTWYCGVLKNQFEIFLEALAFNFKRLVKIKTSPLDLVPVRG